MRGIWVVIAILFELLTLLSLALLKFMVDFINALLKAIKAIVGAMLKPFKVMVSLAKR
ncbi:hypothetical protein IPA_07825 [Ignicoccus pacificus DSM 13166]|uniref:Uncharacterized protein n=1 Tax=Ignicoccus pacificus DSM 13166 TaxID=940294 RepID=A0A977PLW3_9CREN|nr:hypothetical protein IPA_07825 [Ignicoccus pacificus DSM 13166]